MNIIKQKKQMKTIEKSDGTKVEEKRYYISSLLLNINVFSYAIRTHWNAENKLHWHMDFTFKCDDTTTMNKKALYNLQIIKKFCLTILNEVKKIQKLSFMTKSSFLIFFAVGEHINYIKKEDFFYS